LNQFFSYYSFGFNFRFCPSVVKLKKEEGMYTHVLKQKEPNKPPPKHHTLAAHN